MEFVHKSVLLQEAVDALSVKDNGIYVDATAGGGGHSSEIIKKLGSERQEPFIDLLNVIVVRIDLAGRIHTSITPALIEKRLTQPEGKV